MLQVDILYPSLVIGVVTATLSLIGLLIGHRMGEIVGKRMEVVGGLILIGIGIRIVLSHSV
jgi:putative Mn2+ efflux pump MntP